MFELLEWKCVVMDVWIPQRMRSKFVESVEVQNVETFRPLEQPRAFGFLHSEFKRE